MSLDILPVFKTRQASPTVLSTASNASLILRESPVIFLHKIRVSVSDSQRSTSYDIRRCLSGCVSGTCPQNFDVMYVEGDKTVLQDVCVCVCVDEGVLEVPGGDISAVGVFALVFSSGVCVFGSMLKKNSVRRLCLSSVCLKLYLG